MSTSPDAKQAAVAWAMKKFDAAGTLMGQQSRDAYAEGYNAATAKLRERYDEVHAIAIEKDRLWSEACNEAAKLREAVERLYALVDASHYERAKAIRNAL